MDSATDVGGIDKEINEEKSQFFSILEQNGSTGALSLGKTSRPFNGEFDPGSELTLAECITHASRARVADYCA